MTNQEINLKIAEINGYTPFSGCCCLVENKQLGAVSVIKDGKPYCRNYINDWNLLGPLVLALIGKHWNTARSHRFALYKWWDDNHVSLIENEDFGKATCLAYIKEFGDE